VITRARPLTPSRRGGALAKEAPFRNSSPLIEIIWGIGERLAIRWLMTRVPLDERRRLFLARERASQTLGDQRLAPAFPHPLSPTAASQHRMRLVVKAVVIAMLVGAGLVVFQTVTFNLPASLVEALLPRF